MSAEVFQASGHLQSQLGGGSSPEEWNEYGREFYEAKKWEPAMECFKNAGNGEMLRKAEAFLAEEHAWRLEVKDKKREARDAYRAAAGGLSLVKGLASVNMDLEVGEHFRCWDECGMSRTRSGRRGKRTGRPQVGQFIKRLGLSNLSRVYLRISGMEGGEGTGSILVSVGYESVSCEEHILLVVRVTRNCE